MKNKVEEMSEVQLHFIDESTIEQVKVLYPAAVAEAIEKGQAFGLAIEEEEEIRGALGAVLMPEDDRLEILSLYVTEDSRRRYLGTTLLLETINSILEETEGELKLVTISFPERIPGMREFIENLGFILECYPHEGSFFLNNRLLENSVLNRKSSQPITGVTSWNELNDYEVKELYHQLETEGIAYLQRADLKKVRGELSFVKKDSSGKMLACCIITGSERPVLAQFYSAKGNTKYGVAVLTAALGRFLMMPQEQDLEVPCISMSSIKLLQRLVPEAEKENYIRAYLRV